MIQKLYERLQKLEALVEISNPDDHEFIESEYHSIQREFEDIEMRQFNRKQVPKDEANEARLMQLVARKLDRIRKNYDFFDAEAELDMMFPDRHDADFDEDNYSMDFED